MFYFQIVLKIKKDPDSGVFWIRVEIFDWIRIQLITYPKHCLGAARKY